MSATQNPQPSAERLAAVEAMLAQIEKAEGKGIVRRMTDKPEPIANTPTGALALDIALGLGGLPKGRIVEIFGPESSGKTTLCYHIMAEAQKLGGIVGFIDAEHAMDAAYAAKIGLDVNSLVVSQPDYGEQALKIANTMVDSGAFDVIVVDSVAALIPKSELEGQIGDSSVGLQARMMSQAMRKLPGACNRNGTLLVFTNQIREKIGVMFGSPETQPGGRALKFAASVRLDIRRIETLKEGTDAVGTRVRVKVVKNKVAAPFKQAEFDNTFGLGFDHESTLIDLATADKDVEKALKAAGEEPLVAKSGSFFTFRNGEKAQGKNKAKTYLKDNPEVAAPIEARLREILLPQIEETVEAPAETAELAA